MTAKTYTQRGNCARAAKVALGKTAKAGKDFEIRVHAGDVPSYSWERLGPAKTASGKRRPKGESPLAQQPQMVKLLKMCARKTGATIKDLAANLSKGDKPIEEHTVRGSISRLAKEGTVFTKVRDGRTLTYHVGESAEAAAEAAKEEASEA